MRDARRERPVVAAVIKSYPPGFRSGGPGRSVSSLVELLGDDLDFRVITSVDDNGYDLTQDGVEVGRWQHRNGANVFTVAASKPRAALQALRELRRLRPDVVYLNTFFNPVFAIAPLAARRFGLLSGTRFVVAPRGEFSPGALGLKASKKSRFLRAFLRSGAGRQLTWHATSDLEADAIRTALGDVNVTVAPVLRAMAPGAGTDATSRHEGPLRVVLLSKIDRMKNVVGALEAIARCQADVHLTIAGPVKEPDYWAECQETIARLGLTDRVSYHGPVDPDEVTDFLAGFDLFFLPTKGENFGHVILEALAASVPVLISDTTRWGGIETEGAGWVVPFEDSVGFACAIDRFARSSATERADCRRAALAVATRYIDDPEGLRANRQLLWPAFERSVPRVAVVNYSFPVTTQTFHHRRHRVWAEAGALEGVHFVKPADGDLEPGCRPISDYARPIPRSALLGAAMHLLRPRVVWQLVQGVRLASAENGEGGRAGFVWQALNGAALGRQLRGTDVDVIHAVFASAPATMALFAARAAGKPWSVEVHSPTSAQTNPTLLAMKLSQADAVFAISDYTAQMVRRLAPAATVPIVHCGIERCGVDTSPAMPRGNRACKYDVLAVGSLIPKKGHDVLIDASAQLADRLSHRVGIVGGGPLRDDLRAQIERTGAPVTLLGALPPERVAELRADSRVGVLASVRSTEGDEDGVPVSLMEFMAEGVPVVSTDVAGIAELLDEGRAGAVVSAGSAEELSRAIERALTDDTWRGLVAELAIQRVAEHFDNRVESMRLLDFLRATAQVGR